jgi:hypothetical protein
MSLDFSTAFSKRASRQLQTNATKILIYLRVAIHEVVSSPSLESLPFQKVKLTGTTGLVDRRHNPSLIAS